MQTDEVWQGWFDGSALPNPGRIGIGIVLQAPDGSVCERSLLAGASGCNNEAELHALCALLEMARERGLRRLLVHGDSDVAVRYVSGAEVTGIERLGQLISRAQQLLGDFDEISLRWVPRHRNSAADGLSRRALGLPEKPPAAPGKAGRSRIAGFGK